MYSDTLLKEDQVRALYCTILINSLTLVTATFDPIGVCVDPLAASVNHSCEPNAVVVFDGPQLSLRAPKGIREGEEITISYIDNTEPFHRRQRQLLDRYFFQCACQKCQCGSTQREDRLPGNASDGHEYAALEARCFNLLEEVRKTPGAEAPSGRLLEAVDGLKSLPHGWPVDRQPWPSLRQQLGLSYLASGEWLHATLHMLKTYFDIDPLLFPQSWHPVRVVHNWCLVMLLLQISSLHQSAPWTLKTVAAFEVDYGKVVWGLLTEVESNVGQSHGHESRFAKLVRKKRHQVKTDMARDDAMHLERLQDKHWLEKEWSKLRQIAELADAPTAALVRLSK
ncbi:MAG: hypothetical protein M1833_004818 [Piccolia ochrophora]|nr:MAG: hypothetical protein M1833_004818 [Piccolia ochrophora]